MSAQVFSHMHSWNVGIMALLFGQLRGGRRHSHSCRVQSLRRSRCFKNEQFWQQQIGTLTSLDAVQCIETSIESRGGKIILVELGRNGTGLCISESAQVLIMGSLEGERAQNVGKLCLAYILESGPSHGEKRRATKNLQDFD